MNRVNVIQACIDKTGAKNYLEIGVNNGECLFNIRAKNRIAVDPEFRFNFRTRLSKSVKKHDISFHEVTSDDFFSHEAANVIKAGIDVAFIDGLHTWKQVMKDVENTLHYLNPGGIIILHDCNPLNAAGAYPVKHSISEVIAVANKGELPGWNGQWNGDVWKAVVELRSTRDDLVIFTLDLDWGLAVITRGKPEAVLNYSAEAIEKMSYLDLEANREKLLQLKPPVYLSAFLDQFSASR
jgi:hypothetical protein